MSCLFLSVPNVCVRAPYVLASERYSTLEWLAIEESGKEEERDRDRAQN